jgi:hypothetical protein
MNHYWKLSPNASDSQAAQDKIIAWEDKTLACKDRLSSNREEARCVVVGQGLLATPFAAPAGLFQTAEGCDPESDNPRSKSKYCGHAEKSMR